jgi:PKD repeat protein
VVGATLTFSGSFTDAGTLDTHDVRWDFGDGTVVPFTSSTAPGALTPTHVYTTSGSFTVTLTVRDDDLTVGSASTVVMVGLPQFFAGAPKASAGNPSSLTQAQLQPVVTQAIAQLAAAGYNVSGLGQVQFHVAALPDSLLGLTYQTTIWIDPNAQGYGWYIDTSRCSNAAFTQVTGTHEVQAAPGSPAYGHVDLLTVVTHELGHVLGFASIDVGIPGHDWMTATLATGVRRDPDPARGSHPPSATGAHTLAATDQAPAAGTGSLGSTSSLVTNSSASLSGPDSQGGPTPLVPRPGSNPAEIASTGLDVIPAPVSLDLVDARLLDPVLGALLDGRRRGAPFSNLRRDKGNRPKALRTLPALTPERVDTFLEQVARHAVLQPIEKSRPSRG